MSIERERLLQFIYEGPLETPPWQMMVSELRQCFRASHVVLLFHRSRNHELDFDEVLDFGYDSSDMAQQYRSGYSRMDPFPYFTMQAGKVYPIGELVGDLKTNIFYQEFLHPAGVDDIIMFYVEEPGGFRCWISLARGQDVDAFSVEDIADCEWIAKHLQSALKMYAALKVVELERDIYASAQRNLQMGYVLLDQHGHVLRMDLQAEQLLTKNPDIFLESNELKIRHPEKDAELRQIISEGLQCHDPNFSRGLNIQGKRHLGLLIKSAPHSPILSSHKAPNLVLYINEPTAPLAPRERIAEIFELSSTEAALVVELVRGRTLAEAAKNIHISEQTARSYSKNIFSKTGTHRQSDLVRLILSSVALVA